MKAIVLGLLLVTAFVALAAPNASAACVYDHHGQVGPLYYDTGEYGTGFCSPHPPCVGFQPC